jgi:hypothetical protein
MGFPFESATWGVVDGAMYIGAGSGAPGFYTYIAVVVSVVVLWKGNKEEHERFVVVGK